MKKVFAVTAVLALLCLGGAAHAVTIATVPVGNPGNAGELSGAGAGGYGPDRICGSVAYSYNIGKYEVTAGQYTDFLNAKATVSDPYGLYSTYMADPTNYGGCNIQRGGGGTVPNPYTYTVASDWANRPVNYVSYWDSLRFANWLGNGQGAGATETGAYTLGGYNGQDGRTIQRNAGWKWAVTSEDEWYKAAYYKGGNTTAGYWDYPTKSNTAPANQVLSTDPGNSANYYSNNGYAIGGPYWRTNVGEFENSASAYGTFDQGGNVWEWDEAIVYEDSNYAYRGLRGGAFVYGYYINLQASYRYDYDSYYYYDPTHENLNIGFRVSEVVPEPSSIIALSGGLISLLGIRRRRV
jgi:sulfatase modifying factor 1